MERWKQIEGTDGYEISDAGRVRNSSGTLLRPMCKHGYLSVNLYNNHKQVTFQVDRLVANAFIDGRESGNGRHYLRHLNGDANDNRACNIAYAGIPEDVLRKEYERDGLSSYEIAEKHHYNPRYVRRMLVKAGIELRGLKDEMAKSNARRSDKVKVKFLNEFPDAPEKVAESRARRREYMKKHREHDNGITWVSVGFRDNWICGICGKPVDPQAIGSARPTVDHIMPICMGGTDTWDNVQLAHLGCNMRKGVSCA